MHSAQILSTLWIVPKLHHMTHLLNEREEFLHINNDQIPLHVNTINSTLNLFKYFGVFQGTL